MIPRPGTFPLSEITEEARVILKLVPNLSYLAGVEVGTLRGKTAAILLLHRPGLFLTCVDDWSLRDTAVDDSAEAVYDAFESNVAPYPHRVQVVADPSLVAAARVASQADFVYLDAQHTREAVAADIRAWWPHVRPGGLLMGHDYGRKGPGDEDHGWDVAGAVDEWLEREGLGLDHLEATTWAIQKRTS